MNDIYFSQIREDSLVERTILDQNPRRRIICIGSGGCTAFSLLRDDVESVTAVDFNRSQCALIELKLKAIEFLTRNEFLEFIGEKASEHSAKERGRVFEELVSHLSHKTASFWNSRKHQIETGINTCGITDKFYRFVSDNLRKSVVGEDSLRAIFQCRSIDEQISLLKSTFSTERWKTGMYVLFSKTTQTLFYPPFWYANSDEREFADFVIECFERELSTRLAKNNYFLSQLLLGEYIYDQPNGTPHYLSEDGYEETRRNLGKFNLVNSTLQDSAKQLNGADAYFVSNVFDWGTEKNVAQICRAIEANAVSGALLLYRNMYKQTKLPIHFASAFKVDKDASRSLYEMDRSLLYRYLTLGSIN